jgi:hypothetical protein
MSFNEVKPEDIKKQKLMIDFFVNGRKQLDTAEFTHSTKTVKICSQIGQEAGLDDTASFG